VVHADALPGSDESIFVRSNKLSSPVVALSTTSVRVWPGPMPAPAPSSPVGRTGEAVGDQSIASSSSSSRECISASRDCEEGRRGAGPVDCSVGGGGRKDAGLREGWPKMGRPDGGDAAA
jgi:hypothetical protein